MPNSPMLSNGISDDKLGVLALLGLAGESEQAWLAAATENRMQAFRVANTAECDAFADGRTPTVVVASAWPHIDSRLLNTNDRALRRSAVVIVAPDRAEADYWRNLAWDALAYDADHSLIRETLASALEEADRRRREWDFVEDFHHRYNTLSYEELKVLEAVCDGMLNKQIAKELGVSIRTVEQRRRKVFDKMGVDSAIPLAGRLAKVKTLETSTRRRDAPAATPKPNLLPSVGSIGRISPNRLPG